MPPRPRPWFRFYSEAADSLKVHELPDRLVKPWLIMLCLANTNTPRGRLPSHERVAFKLRVKEEKAKAFIAELVTRHFIDYADGHYVMHEWDDWQKDRDVAPSLRDGKRDDSHANSDESVRKITLEQEQEKELEQDGEREQEAEQDLPPAHPFSVLFSKHHRERTGKILAPAVHGRALSLEQKYGAEDCIQVAELKGWDHDPGYYVGALEDLRNGKQLQTAGVSSGRGPRGAPTTDVTAEWERYKAGES